MSDFSADGASEQGYVNPVYIQIGTKDAKEIFPTSYNVKDSCKLLGSPSEGGLMQYDNKVTQPREITFTGIVKKEHMTDLIEAARDLVGDNDLNNILCKFYGKSGEVDKMVIESCEEIGSSNRYDAIEVKFVLREYLEHNSSSGSNLTL